MLKVVHLQKRTTSAGKAALRLHSAFLEAGISSNILSLQADGFIIVPENQNSQKKNLFIIFLMHLITRTSSLLTKKMQGMYLTLRRIRLLLHLEL
jgi:hypothetical protein